MIKKISKLKNCGIFRDFKWDNSLPEFSRYNLFYGLNGSGKSTLSHALSYFFAQEADGSFGDYEIEVAEASGVSVGNKITNKTLSNPIYIFSKDFIQKNIDVEGKLDEIIYLSEENIEAKAKVETLKKEIERQRARREITKKTYDEKKKNFDKLAPSIAKKLKTMLVELGGLAAHRYANFDKNGVERWFAQNREQLAQEVCNSDAEIEKLKTALKESVIASVELSFEKADEFLLKRAVENAKLLLKRTVRKEVAMKFSREVLNWIELGLPLHEGIDECSFCGGIITDERAAFLKQLFSDEYKLFVSQIETSIKELEAFVVALIDFTATLYDEFKTQADKAVVSLNKNRIKLNKILAMVVEQLVQKKANVEKLDFADILLDDLLLANINTDTATIGRCIQETNSRTKNFEKKQLEELEQLVGLLLHKFLREEKYAEMRDDLNKSTLEDKNIEAAIQAAEKEKTEIESGIRDVLMAAATFNSLLHQFLGRQEISLEFDDTLKGYKLIREKKKAERLSDGEKTAIAFIYFLTKIKENGNEIENTIVVLDDPISSLDSNNLFNAFAFIVATFEKSHQFFVFTHNFTFFSLLKRKIGKELKKGENMYLVENKYAQLADRKVRTACISKLPATLQTLNSDYAFSFKYIKETIDARSVIADLNDYFVLSNSCRKILETFCSFKLINKQSFDLDTVKILYTINNSAGESLTVAEVAEAEKIFKFVNYYSHGAKFSIESEIDGIIGESLAIAECTLKLIERADPVHYKQIIEAISRD